MEPQAKLRWANVSHFGGTDLTSRLLPHKQQRDKLLWLSGDYAHSLPSERSTELNCVAPSCPKQQVVFFKLVMFTSLSFSVGLHFTCISPTWIQLSYLSMVLDESAETNPFNRVKAGNKPWTTSTCMLLDCWRMQTWGEHACSTQTDTPGRWAQTLCTAQCTTSPAMPHSACISAKLREWITK